MAKRSRETSLIPGEDGGHDSDSEEVMSPSKAVEVDTTSSTPVPVMYCDLPPHKETLSFMTYEDYEVHYSKSHMNRCSACGKNFPTSHFLNLHMEENHNPLREALAARGEKTYGCFVEDCERKCSTPQKRRLHLIDKHMFPKVSSQIVGSLSFIKRWMLMEHFQGYNFRIVDKGIDQVDSMLAGGPRRRLSGFHDKFEAQHDSSSRKHHNNARYTPTTAMNSSTTDTGRRNRTRADVVPQAPAKSNQSGSKNDTDIDQLGAAMSALKFIPTSVQLKKQSGG